MKENYKTQEKIYDAEVLESSTFDENIIIKILVKANLKRYVKTEYMSSIRPKNGYEFILKVAG